MLTRREILLAQLSRIQDKWVQRNGDIGPDVPVDAKAEAAFYRSAKPILDELRSLAGLADNDANPPAG